MITVDRINGVTGDLAIKTPVRVATTANITLEGLQTIDGVALAADDRVLVKNQTTAASNGIWIANTSAWSRALDFDGRFDVVQGTMVPVVLGTVNGGSAFKLDTASPVVGTSSLSFSVANDFALRADLASTASGKGADLVANAVRRFATVALMSAMASSSIPVSAEVDGYAAASDGAGGSFYYVPGSSQTVDNGLVFTANGGRWFRNGWTVFGFNGEIQAKWFGVKGDGTTDDAAGLLAAVASNRRVHLPEGGTCLIRSALVWSSISNFEIIGTPGTTIKCHATDVFTNSALAFSTCSKFKLTGVTIDQNNNASFTATRPVVLALSCTDFHITDNEVLKFTYIGLGVDSCQRFWVKDNRIERDTAINTVNYAINVSSTVTTSTEGEVSGNKCQRSGSVFRGLRIHVLNNVFNATKYGAGLTTSGDGTANLGQYVVMHNICSNGAGTDIDGVDVAGMELDGYYSVFSHNTCFANAGKGIAMLAFRSTLKGNLCFGNGVNGGGAAKQSGIAMGYVSATHGAHHCHVEGNTCFDIGGPTQLYGYYEESASLVGIMLGANKFDGNGTADVFLQGTSGWYDDASWTAYTPTLTSTTGTITTVGAVSARYRRQGKTVFWKASCTITTNGTGASKVQITLPSGPGNVANGPFVCYGRENGITGKMLIGQFLNGTQNVQAAFYDDTYPGANGAVMLLEGFYEVL